MGFTLTDGGGGGGCNPAADKYLKKFIKKFWLKSIPELEDDIICDNNNTTPQSDSKHFDNNSEQSYEDNSEPLSGEHKSAKAKLEMSQSCDGKPPNSDRQTSSLHHHHRSQSQSNKSFHRTHRRLPSYGNIDLIFV